MCTDTQTCESKIKDDCESTYTDGFVSVHMDAMCTEDPLSACTDGSACAEYCVSDCTDVSSENTGVHGSMCPYIYTKGTNVHVVTSMYESKLKTFACDRTDAYDKYRRDKPKRYICTDIVEKAHKGIRYADTLQQVL